MCDLTFEISLLIVRSIGVGAKTEILERGGAWTRKFYFTMYEEAIKNALK